MKAKVTDKLLRAIMANGQPHEPISDQVLRGLEFRFSKRGEPSGSVKARLCGSTSAPIRLSAGRYPERSLAEIRERGWLLLRDLKNGIDPRERAAELKRAEAVKRSNTYGAVAEELLKRHVARARTARAIELRVRRELIARWGDRPITDITRADVIHMLDEIVDRGHPEGARQTLMYGGRLHDWAIARGIYGLEKSPYDRLSARDLLGSKKSRQRVLSDDELVLIWRATADWPLYGPYVRLLLLLGVRPNELARAIWDEIDLEKALWVIPPERMKSDEGLSVPLPPAALEILCALPALTRCMSLRCAARAHSTISARSSSASTSASLRSMTARRLGIGPCTMQEGRFAPRFRPWALRRTSANWPSAKIAIGD
jgi:integrase